MEILPPSLEDLNQAIEGGLLKRVRLLMTVMAAAPLVYLALGYWSVMKAPEGDAGVNPLFMELLGAVSFGTFLMAWIIPAKILDPKKLAQYFEKGMPKKGGELTRERPEIVAGAFNRYYVMKCTFLGTPAIHGLLIIFLAAGVVRTHPLYWLALVPSAVVPFSILWIMPTEDSLHRLFEEKFLAAGNSGD